MENKYVSGLIGIGLFLLGGLCGKSIPNTNTNSNGNTITISQEVPENSAKFRNFQEKAEKSRKFQQNSENSEKMLNINTATLQDCIDAKVGIGEAKYPKLVDNRPYKAVEELRSKNVIGRYAYENNKHRFTVGD